MKSDWDEILAEGASDFEAARRSSREYGEGRDAWENMGTSALNPYDKHTDPTSFQWWSDGFNAAAQEEFAA